MFTEGLDPHSLRWVREGANSMLSRQQRIDPLHPAQNGGVRGFGLPPMEKFQNGHLPTGAIPVSHNISTMDDSVSGSDMDETSDTEEEVFGGRYSLDSSSPQEDVPQRRVPSGTERYAEYSSETYSYSDLSSSRDTLWQPQKVQQQQQRRQVHGNVYTEEEDEETDSGGSSDFTNRAGRTNGGVSVPSRRSYPVESYSRNGFRADLETNAEKDLSEKFLPNKKLHDADVPSAPPFHATGQETKHTVDQVSASRVYDTPRTVDSDGSSIKTEPTLHTHTDQFVRNVSIGVETTAYSGSVPFRIPTFHASAQGPWHSVIAYDACVRLCLHSWARGCMEAPMFLENECALLRNAFSLQQILLQSEEELLAKRSSGLVTDGAAPKLKRTIGKMKVQVRKVRMALDLPSGCSFSSLKLPTIKLESFRYHLSSLQSTFSSGWESLRKVRVVPRLPANNSFSRHSLAYVHASTQYIKQVSGLLKIGVTTLRSSSSYEMVQETYSCMLRLKSSPEEDAIRMQSGTGETHVFFPDSLGDDLIIEVYDSKGKFHGRVLAQVATIVEDSNDKNRWWPIYLEPEHELVGRLQLYLHYTTGPDENGSLKCGSVAETVAYDLVLEVAMKAQHFHQRNLLLHGSWKWLLTEFASYYGVSDAYTKLRYLSYVMDVATPTADCLTLVHDLMSPVIMRNRSKSTLSHQENRILGEIEEQIEQVLSMVFENYKSLDESTPSGMMEVFMPATGTPAPALVPAVKLYTLLHDVLSPEAQLKLCSYFQTAAKKRSRRHLVETDEFVANNSEGLMVDVVTLATAYQKMKLLCLNIRNEIYTDIEIHNHHVLPSFIDLPNISASIYSVELCSRLRAFLVACPPTGPSPPVAELVIATADFQRDIASWNICSVKGGVDAKELFHLYIVLWIQDKRLSLLDSCKLDKQVKWSGVRTQHSTTPFVDDMYDRLKETLNEYEVIICRWPEYTFVLENAIADIEKALVEALEKQYADVLAPLKENMTPKIFAFKYVQKLAKRNSVNTYIVPEELGILLNSMKRLLDVLRPKIEMQLKSWGSCIPDGGNTVSGERLSEVTVLLRAKFRNYLQAIVEKLAENTRGQSATKLKKIIKDSKDIVMESDIRSRMQTLKDQLIKTIDHLHAIFDSNVFVMICRGFWDRLGQDVLNFLENRKENRSWYKASRVAVAVLDDTFASQMQQLLGNALQEKDVEPPRSIMEVRSVLCKDVPNPKDSNFYY